jgi:hypothetical protein
MTKPTNDEYTAHEALDRTCMVMQIVEQHLLEHPHIQADPMLTETVEHVCTSLMHVYQAIGKDHL